jgi:hypothetical protein
MIAAAHMREALRWTTDEPTDRASMLAGAFGMAVPLAIAAAYGHLTLGLAGAVGSLLMGNGSTGRTITDLAVNELKVLATLALAAAIVAVIAEHGVASDIAIVVIVGLAAIVGGYSRQMGVTTGRFIIFLSITFSAASGRPDAILIFPLIGLTAIWTSALIFVFGAIARTIDPPARLMPPSQAPIPMRAERFARFRETLMSLKGWQFTLRIVICFAISVTIAAMFPTHRFFWIALTVALVCQRPLEPWPLRTTQRAIGTFIGVVIAWLTIAGTVPEWALVVLLGVLSGLRLGLRTRNYLLFSAFMTPVIMLILDAGRPVEPQLLTDRIIATLIGAGLVILVNRAMVAVVAKWG